MAGAGCRTPNSLDVPLRFWQAGGIPRTPLHGSSEFIASKSQLITLHAWRNTVTLPLIGPLPSGGLRVRLPNQQQLAGVRSGAVAGLGHFRDRSVHRVRAVPECPPSFVHAEVLQALRRLGR